MNQNRLLVSQIQTLPLSMHHKWNGKKLLILYADKTNERSEGTKSQWDVSLCNRITLMNSTLYEKPIPAKDSKRNMCMTCAMAILKGDTLYCLPEVSCMTEHSKYGL